jgi:hypothetical protein
MELICCFLQAWLLHRVFMAVLSQARLELLNVGSCLNLLRKLTSSQVCPQTKSLRVLFFGLASKHSLHRLLESLHRRSFSSKLLCRHRLPRRLDCHAIGAAVWSNDTLYYCLWTLISRNGLIVAGFLCLLRNCRVDQSWTALNVEPLHSKPVGHNCACASCLLLVFRRKYCLFFEFSSSSVVLSLVSERMTELTRQPPHWLLSSFASTLEESVLKCLVQNWRFDISHLNGKVRDVQERMELLMLLFCWCLVSSDYWKLIVCCTDDDGSIRKLVGRLSIAIDLEQFSDS